MPKKVVKKKKIKIKIVPILLLILIVVLAYFLIRSILSFKIQNIYIHGTKYLNDNYIMDTAKISGYPSFILNFSKSIEQKLENSIYIKDATVKKSFLGVLDIYIEEREVILFREYDKKYVLDDASLLDSVMYKVSPPRAINYIPDTVYDNFISHFAKLNSDVRDKISEIKYDPSEYDNSRFLLYMIDGNYVYITITKMDSLNYYNEIYPTLEGKKGTLYLDSGNHFQAF